MSEARADSPRSWGVTTDADWEPLGEKPSNKRHPYPGELELLQAQAKREAGKCNRDRDYTWWQRKVSRLFYGLVVRRRIYIEGM